MYQNTFFIYHLNGIIGLKLLLLSYKVNICHLGRTMKHVFIVNPTSGKGYAKKLIPVISKICIQENINYIIEPTEYPIHATEIATSTV